MKDDEKRNLVTDLCAVAVQARGAEQLRERIKGVLLPALDAQQTEIERLSAALQRAESEVGYQRGIANQANAEIDSLRDRLAEVVGTKLCATAAAMR